MDDGGRACRTPGPVCTHSVCNTMDSLCCCGELQGAIVLSHMQRPHAHASPITIVRAWAGGRSRQCWVALGCLRRIRAGSL